MDGAVKAICNRLAVAEMSDRTSKDLGNALYYVTTLMLMLFWACIKLEHRTYAMDSCQDISFYYTLSDG